MLIEEDRIAAVGEKLQVTGAERLDATGLIVAPGFIDMHVHLREPGFEYAETIETGSRAAAAGGFTTICCMPNTSPVNDNATVTSYIIERAERNAVVNVFPIGAITKGSAGQELAAIGSMKQAGIVAISDDGQPVMNARADAPRHGDRAVLRDPRDRPLRGPAPERRRRHARRRSERAAGAARNSGGVGRRDGGARHSAGRVDRRALPRGAHFVAPFGGDGGVRQEPRPRRDLRGHAAPFRACRIPRCRPTTATTR